MLPALALSVALSATAVPPGYPVENHAHPAHFAQPTVQIFERKPVDDYRKANWIRYNAELDSLWKAYRKAGSTPEAWQAYQQSVEAAKRRYLIADPYLLPILNPPVTFVPPWEQGISSSGAPTGAHHLAP